VLSGGLLDGLKDLFDKGLLRDGLALWGLSQDAGSMQAQSQQIGLLQTGIADLSVEVHWQLSKYR
jgi:hypothetical protein